ncbi:dimethylarginine dimethylaminohydrolase family protein [Roseivirga echinicomitans]|uniref:arginine deiminase n=1 Tax=Roseivirga echinicomitans TaxID=296218 RepID=A0A150XVP1_9BACT|nr:arginine deiminase family protein [Roseivirga echinicomitans]KYG82827.1 hypothetical protein AWN68_13655 [Roseivirga echinicomitans]
MSEVEFSNSGQKPTYLKLNVKNETDKLEAVVLGIGTDLGEESEINPTSKYHKEEGTYPTEEDIQQEISTFEKVLKAHGVKVYRPKNIEGLEQVFTRDIGFVIDSTYVVASMQEEVRQLELPGVKHITNKINPQNIIHPPKDANVEGGDVILWNDHIFVGISARTNTEGYEFIKASFPNKQVHAIPLVVSKDRKKNILHLDCTFQPIGIKDAIIYENGFAERPQIIYDLFKEEDMLKVDQAQMNRMYPNIFSLSPKDIVVERSFKALIAALKERGYIVHEVDYTENSKLSGLLRCSTMPLIRS